MALHSYARDHGCFPPAYIADADGRPMHSWRALLLPYIDPELAKSYSFDEPWNGPNNSKLLNRMPERFRCLSDMEAPDGTTNYVAVVGTETMWPFDLGRKATEVADGEWNTIQLVEVTGLNIPWLEPRDLEFDKMDFRINSPTRESISSHHPGGALVWTVAGSRPMLRDDTPAEKVRGLLTVAGGEKVDFP